MRESLRLYPAASIFARVAARDDTLGGYDIPKGGVVFFSPSGMHVRI